MVGRLVGWLVGWLIGRLVGWFSYLQTEHLEEDSRLPRPLVDRDLCALIERHIVNDLSEHCRGEATKLIMGADSEQEYMTLGAWLAYQAKFQSWRRAQRQASWKARGGVNAL